MMPPAILRLLTMYGCPSGLMVRWLILTGRMSGGLRIMSRALSQGLCCKVRFIRMCIFPKSMPYNNNEPDCFPFFADTDGKWDVEKLDFGFWDNLDERIAELCEIGVEADLILFHPYDRWGFAALSQKESLIYLEYCIARLSAFRNVWWSLANEYEMVYKKSMDDWNEYGELLKRKDPYGHLISIHNILMLYPKKDWMTHCSIQTKDIHHIPYWKQEYEIPIIIDECGYEGDIEYDWGNLSAFEMVHRFWWAVCRGGFCTHGETFHKDDEILWWAKGGRLFGESEKRIAFLKDLLYSLPGDGEALFRPVGTNPNLDKNDEEAVRQDDCFRNLLEKIPRHRKEELIASAPMLLSADGYRLHYFGRTCPIYMRDNLPKDGVYRVEVIDIWTMTRTTMAEEVNGHIKIGLPGKEGIAVLVTGISGASLKISE
ncbi:MAG TPA: DUF4038 domain-containing protein [Clostridiales bacterium]|nr:DUF4038 domain-containing protein [Clostridiales bacterium]